MIENILNLVRNEVIPAVDKADIPQEKKQQVVDTTTSTILGGLKDQLIPGNVSEVMSLFGKGSSASSASSFGSNIMTKTIQSSVASALTQKVGLSSGIAASVAAAVVPAVMSLLNNKVQDDKEPGFNIESLMKSLGGSKAGDNDTGGLAGMLGGLFNK